MNCQHCHQKPVNRTRGLCHTCHRNLAIRNLYPVDERFLRRGAETEEELEQVIREQMRCLPSWWERERA